MEQVVLFQEINDACDNHKRLKFHNGHRSLVTIVSGTEIVKSSALSVDTEYTVLIVFFAISPRRDFKEISPNSLFSLGEKSYHEILVRRENKVLERK